MARAFDLFLASIVVTALLFANLAALYYLGHEGSHELQSEIKVENNSERVEEHLEKYRDVIGEDYEGYRGHIYRVLSYTLHYLGRDAPKFRPVIEIALVYHDLGLWTHSTLAYLEPSSAVAANASRDEGFTPAEAQLVQDIINNHHKITPYLNLNKSKTDAPAKPSLIRVKTEVDVVESVRKADLIDFSFGYITNHMPWRHISKVQAEIPEAGFHLSLVSFFPRLHGFNLPRAVSDISRIFKI
ncbi:hypothetical protein CEUSTIGMA_g6519.t1 [Chlamydomonas eustigma]|uniref:HD domain-containing protein n=1 Tax=Chlamydomonas eustigma TaxID=1157962 RepID=A0A250X826_9CHLO|nr:hypothetical protein CEUSTIGMA_g6519.t1 [Chlamydomonas eustigma]|eukprot:GAX79079.1 hypothetical protein CEUSTIGMA_g6519.t1 [Chlamydomonas eustigma]